MSEQGTHDCPVKGCVIRNLPSHRLMCYVHWRMVTLPLQNTVVRLWNSGKVREGYVEARRSAIEQVQAREQSAARSA